MSQNIQSILCLRTLAQQLKAIVNIITVVKVASYYNSILSSWHCDDFRNTLAVISLSSNFVTFPFVLVNILFTSLYLYIYKGGEKFIMLLNKYLFLRWENIIDLDCVAHDLSIISRLYAVPLICKNRCLLQHSAFELLYL